MSLSCSDVCEVVMELLLQAGFDIDGDEEDHMDMMEALATAKLIKEGENDVSSSSRRG